MSIRKLKVGNIWGCYKMFPCIRVQGKWLEGLGFKCGSRVTLEEKPGEIILRLIDVPEQRMENLTRRRV